ncbi:MAG TPA: HAD family hydrolase [Gammaproteobacteria bacterium]|jgi:phosphoglycolate phosphatase|nr:HAD family hydrolase [Gammaproteobacteria bacterium]
MVKKSYDLIIFDWDGTLMDSKRHIVSCLEYSLQAVNLPAQPNDDLSRVIGLGLTEAITALLPNSDDQTIVAACQAFREKFLAADKSSSQLFPHVETTLTELRQSGYYLAVATGKSRAGLDKVLNESGLIDLFSVTRCADETRSKPHPQMLEEILTDMDTSPQRAIMIGDTEFDLQMATNLRVDSLGVSYGVHAATHLEKFNPLAIVDSVKEIGNWIHNS